ncbi:MAG: HD domain-containing phosphohydrolase [Methylomonas sp.]
MKSELSSQQLPASRLIYQKILIRLLLGWLFLCTMLGGGILWLEINRVERVVQNLALKEASLLSGEPAESLEQINAQSFAHLTQLTEKLIRQHFLMVELYDRNKELKFEVLRKKDEFPEQRLAEYRHQFPTADGFTHEMHIIENHLWLVIFVPLTSSGAEMPIGYLEGVYQVDRETFASIKSNVLRTLIFATLGISFTTLLMYPIVVALIRGVVKLSDELLQGNLELMNALGCAIAARDSDTNSHNYRVTYYALRLGEAVGLAPENLRCLIAGAFLHDVGKIGIRDPILLKPEKLTPAEFEIMKTHVTLGVDIVRKSSWLNGARDVVEFHHEKYDGSGYLKGLRAEEIPVNARIFAIVDVFDALTSKRPYKESWSQTEAIAKLETGGGNHFDPTLLQVYTGLAPRLYRETSGLDANQLEAMLHAIISPYFLSTLK